MRRQACALALSLLVILAATPALAREGRPGEPMPGDPFAGALFPPELLMRHAEKLGLEEGQRDQIIREIQQMQSGVIPLQWQIREETEKLRVVLDQPQVDEQAALARAERIAELEGQVKRTHLALLIRIKNILTDEQRETLRRIREQRGPGPRGR